MPFQEMKIKGAWVHTPIRHNDERGRFEEQFKLSQIESELGTEFLVKQVNQSVSNRGVVRGVHFTESAEGQAKYISCSKGRIWDVVVDLRKDSITYGQWDAAELSLENGKSIFISTGLGHGFLSLEDGSVSTYLCSSEYNSDSDKGVNPLSENLKINFQSIAEQNGITKLMISERDRNAPNF
jgi:dTDP-4-dehydrorhamnose 3,5-epimerase